MRQVNLISIVEAFSSLNESAFSEYAKYHTISIKRDELEDLTVLVKHLRSLNREARDFDKYFLGYKIPQIGKEFDLLRIDERSVINIELKREFREDKIKSQIVRNSYYLSFLRRDVNIFSYVSSTRKLYALNANQELIEVSVSNLAEAIVAQGQMKVTDIDSYFNPSNYLVSPFSSTAEFIQSKYFLTNQQEEIKASILTYLTASGPSILAVKGKAGTGKTLLTFDIAKEVSKTRKVLLVHCGLLNQGHSNLIEIYGWDIIPAKNLVTRNLNEYNLVVVDEAQRMYVEQLERVLNSSRLGNVKCIFSYDAQQTLRRGEISNKIDEKIESSLTGKLFELTTKIRTNREVASFIQSLFDRRIKPADLDYSSVEMSYFDSYAEAEKFLRYLRSSSWKVINYTPSSRVDLPYEIHGIKEENDNAHTVIGQEFDNVVGVIDEYFFYKNDVLSTHNYQRRPYYHPTKMLFQIVSRTRLRLHVVIIRNAEILQRCLGILSKEKNSP